MNREPKNSGIPVSSANVLEPFGYIDSDILKDFSYPSLTWGIDGLANVKHGIISKYLEENNIKNHFDKIIKN